MTIKFVKIAKIFSAIVLIIAVLVLVSVIFLLGYVRGYVSGKDVQVASDQKILSQFVSATSRPMPTTAPTQIIVYTTPAPTPNWGGPQLWDAVNKARVANGVNPLKVDEGLCTIASIRLNELLQLGALDAHVGFSALETRPDIKPIFDSFSDVSEFLVSGATSPQNAVDLWENTLGHKELLTGGQYVWGCIYAQNGFGVAITAY
jgi:uncharacterized protein YkwD